MKKHTRAAVLASVLAVAAGLLSACSLSTADAVCNTGEYPVIAVGSTGSACMKNGETPSKGYARYPKGKVPQHVGDKWDTYWESHTVDAHGSVVPVP
ncbi:SCO0607 family lipoprotein [Streptomyces fuscichromogenes]|uniref:SCO0607 family lipoprotein n=1 Tax=Streptomyces fuscichromogenes TaxID=1324013 RepID=UPI0037FAD9B0